MSNIALISFLNKHPEEQLDIAKQLGIEIKSTSKNKMCFKLKKTKKIAVLNR